MRIYEQVRAVAVDRSRADVVRVGAMHVLDSYVNPRHAGWFGCRPPADGPVRRVYPQTAVAAHAAYTDGPMPLAGSVKVPVLRQLQRIGTARDVESATVRYAAAALALRIQSQTPAAR